MFKKILVCAALTLLAIPIACSDKPSSPASPSAVSSTGAVSAAAGASADDSTLKVNAPTLQSPIAGVRLPDEKYSPTLTIGNARGEYSPQVALTYRFQVFDPAGSRLHPRSPLVSQGATTTSYTLPPSSKSTDIHMASACRVCG